jgi:translation initiation factor IF-1
MVNLQVNSFSDDFKPDVRERSAESNGYFIFGSGPIAGLSAMSEQHIEVEGSITAVLPGTMFRVQLDNQHPVLATICGKMRKRWVRLTVGDRVKMEISPYDLDKARITWRLK